MRAVEKDDEGFLTMLIAAGAKVNEKNKVSTCKWACFQDGCCLVQAE